MRNYTHTHHMHTQFHFHTKTEMDQADCMPDVYIVNYYHWLLFFWLSVNWFSLFAINYHGLAQYAN